MRYIGSIRYRYVHVNCGVCIGFGFSLLVHIFGNISHFFLLVDHISFYSRLSKFQK